MSISVSIAASRLTRSSEGEPSGEERHTTQLLSYDSHDQSRVLASHGCIQKEIQQQFSTAQIGNSVHLYQQDTRQDTNPVENLPSFIRFINRLVLQLETISYERRNLVKSLCEGFRRDTRSHHKVAGPLGPPAVAWSQSSTFYLLGRGRRRYVARQILSSWREGDQDETYRRGGTETRQRHSGHGVLSTHEMKLNTLIGGLVALEGLLKLLL
jgi:hypothetical protein